MDKSKIHVYLMPGLAASPIIFQRIKLPESQFKIHYLEWLIPNSKHETLQAYAKRMAAFVTKDNAVLLGVSFGGILVQEMSRFLNLKKLIIVSSVKTKHELPARLKLLKTTKAYKILPTQLLSSLDVLATFSFGKTITKRIELYKKYLAVNNKQYLDWAIKQVVCWERDIVQPGVIHIHGDQDKVFPSQNITNYITVYQGTHIMIINKFIWFNENLPKLILNKKVV